MNTKYHSELDPYLDEIHTIMSWQYGIPCVVAYMHNDAEKIIQHARTVGAVNPSDPDELCVYLRPEIGPEFYTEGSIRKSKK